MSLAGPGAICLTPFSERRLSVIHACRLGLCRKPSGLGGTKERCTGPVRPSAHGGKMIVPTESAVWGLSTFSVLWEAPKLNGQPSGLGSCLQSEQTVLGG